MKQYIDKAAVVAEIESYKNSFCDRNGYLENSETNGLAYDTLCELEDSIDTLGVKEVDLEKEVNQYFEKTWPFEEDDEDIIAFAEYFFELGLKIK